MDFIQKISYVFKKKYLGLSIDFLSSALLIRYLGAESYGHYTVLYILPIFVTALGSFGFGPSIVYYINNAKFNLSCYLGTFTILGLILGFIYVSIIVTFMSFINESLYDNKLDTSLFFISIFFIPIMITQKYLRAIIRGMYNIKLFSLLLDFFTPFLRFISVVFILFFNLGLEGITAVPILVNGLVTLFMFLYLLKEIKVNTGIFIEKNLFLTITKFSFKNYLGTALQKSNETLIMLIASIVLTFQESGFLSLAMKLLQLIVSTSNSVLTVLMPKISMSSVKQIEYNVPRVTSILFAFNIVAISVYLFLLEYLVVFAYGHDYLEVVTLSVPLALVTMFLPFANILLTSITFSGDPIKKLYARGMGLIFNLILFYPLFILFGSIGFALSIALGQFVIFLSSLHFFRRKFKNVRIYKLFVLDLRDVNYLINIFKGKLSKE